MRTLFQLVPDDGKGGMPLPSIIKAGEYAEGEFVVTERWSPTCGAPHRYFIRFRIRHLWFWTRGRTYQVEVSADAFALLPIGAVFNRVRARFVRRGE